MPSSSDAFFTYEVHGREHPIARGSEIPYYAQEFMKDASLSDPIDGCVVAKHKGLVVGFMRFGTTNTGVFWISSIWVQKMHRRNGVAYTMCMHALRKHQPEDVGVIATSKAALKLFKRMESRFITATWVIVDRSK